MKNKIKKYIIIILALLSILFLLFNSEGFLKYRKLKSEVNELNIQIENIEKQKGKIKKEISSLKTDKKKLEKVAREKYNMKLPNEKVIKIDEN